MLDKIDIDKYLKKLGDMKPKNKNNDSSEENRPTSKVGFWRNFSLISVAISGALMINVAFDVAAENKSYERMESMLQEIRTYYKPASTIRTGYDFTQPLPEMIFDQYTIVPSSISLEQGCKLNNDPKPLDWVPCTLPPSYKDMTEQEKSDQILRQEIDLMRSI